jgi:hypothetical protein
MTQQPIFQPIFGETWDRLPPVIHAHYANRPYSQDRVTVEGRMDITLSPLYRLCSPVLKVLGLLVPYHGTDIPTTVHFISSPTDATFRFQRIFYVPNQKPYLFTSAMEHTDTHTITEWMALGIGWVATYGYDGHKVTMTHQGYRWRWRKLTIPLPLAFFFGKGYAEEYALNDTQFKMRMEIRHPIFGVLYAYQGMFTLTEVLAHD